MLTLFGHFIFLLIFPPLLLGIINKTKAFYAGRLGAPLLQPYYELFKLVHKGMVISTTTTWIFKVGPIVNLIALLSAGLLIPVAGFAGPVAFSGDLFLFAYLFALARFFTTAAALDTGSAFEGMGAAREVTFAVISEPALFFAFLALAKLSGTLTLNQMLLRADSIAMAGATPALVLISIGLFILLLAETCRIPFDDPNTHLELTMIHEVMALDHSGPLFAMIEYAAAVKMFILGSLLLHTMIPFHLLPTAWNYPLFLAALTLLTISIGTIESIMARLRLLRVPFLLVTALLLCSSGLILLYR